MPSYELALMLRAMPKPELKTTLKRISHAIFDRGGIIRNIENLGFRPMPYKTAAHGIVHREANYFVFKIDTATKAVTDLKEEYSRDVDVIRQRVFKSQEICDNNCTLEEEFLPPAYRKDVQEMIEMGKTQCVPILKPNRRYIYYQHNYNSKLEELLNLQIQAEQQAGQDYLNMAVTFLHPSKSQFGAGGFFMRMYKEELDHMQKFIHYQLLRGGVPLICGLEPPIQNKSLTMLEAFKQGLCREKQITELIAEGVKLAEEVKDYQCADVLTSVFLAEQMQSIHEMANHVTKLTALGKNDHALFQYDLELEKKYPYSHKIKRTIK